MTIRITIFFLYFAAFFSACSWASENNFQNIPMMQKSSYTYYINAHVSGIGNMEFLVDTGSGYMTINEDMLKTLERDNEIKFLKNIQGSLADGSTIEVPVYRLASLNIGGNCVLRNIDVAVFPGDTPCILGLSALQKAAPFVFSTNPPTLQLSNCT